MAAALKSVIHGDVDTCWTTDLGRASHTACFGTDVDALRMARRLEHDPQVGGQWWLSQDSFAVHLTSPNRDGQERSNHRYSTWDTCLEPANSGVTHLFPRIEFLVEDFLRSVTPI